jgi:hypothetical protein
MNYKQRVADEEIPYPEGDILSDESDEEPQNEMIESKTFKKLKTVEEDETNYESIMSKNSKDDEKSGWLSSSGLSEEQQMKLFRLMGGKSKADMELLNKRTATYDYQHVSQQAEAEFSQGIKKKIGSKLKGLGNR